MNADLFPVFSNRSFGPMAQPGFRLQVERMTWDVQGGPRSARLYARVAGPVDLDQFAALLRCGAIIYTAQGSAAWWGLVWSVRIQDGQTGVWITLDDLANRVRTVYGMFEPEATGAGLRSTTGWADDLTSQSIYGVKEAQISLSLATTDQAESYRDQTLATQARVSPRPTVGLGANISQITIDLRGYWDSLGWRFYSNSTGLIENLSRAPNVLVNFCTAAGDKIAQSITVTAGNWRVESLWFCIRRVGAGSTLTASLCSDSAGSPGGVLASGTLAGATLSNHSPAWVRFLLTSPVVVSAGTYWVVVDDGGALVNYRILVDTQALYSGGVAKTHAFGGAWGGATSYDLQFRVAGTMETSEQIKLMAAAAGPGQFLAGIRVEQASGVYTNPHRDGDVSALEELQAQLDAGTSAGAKLQAAVSVERFLVVSERPESTAARWIVRSDGIIRLPGGQAAQPGPGLAGSWAVLDTKWSINSANWIAAPGRVFIERVEWAGGFCRAVANS